MAGDGWRMRMGLLVEVPAGGEVGGCLVEEPGVGFGERTKRGIGGEMDDGGR
jgi:hypothetical protein